MRVRPVFLLSLAALLACSRGEAPKPPAADTPPVSAAPSPSASLLPARITWIELGNSTGGNGRVTTPASVFTPKDTIYVAVLTDGERAGSVLSARWTYEDGQVVSEGQETLEPGDRATEFHIAKPDGWPAGRYKVDIALNGQPAATREFEVR